MTHTPPDDTQSIDALLRAAGPSLPEPRAPQQLIDSVHRLLESDDPIQALQRESRFTAMLLPSRRRSNFLTILAVAALIALAWIPAFFLLRDNVSLRADMNQLRRQLAAAASPAGVEPGTLLVVNFHHDMCPRAKVVTPKFKELCQTFSDRPVSFVNMNVTGEGLILAAQTAKELEVPELLSGDPGLRTGIIKIVDPASHRILAASSPEGDTSPITEMLSHLEPRNGS